MSRAFQAVTYFYACCWVNFVNGIPGRSTRLAVQVVALHEHRIVTKATQPDVALAPQIQLHALANVQSIYEKCRLDVQPLNPDGSTHLARSDCSVRCTLLSAPRQKRLPPEGST